MTPENHADLVRRGYDQVAEPYLDARDQWKSIPYLGRLLARLRPGSRILDVGCGSGIPIDSYLTEKGHEVIGIDISPRQVELGRRTCQLQDSKPETCSTSDKENSASMQWSPSTRSSTPHGSHTQRR